MARKLRYAIQHCTEMDADFKLTDAEVVGWGGTQGASVPNHASSSTTATAGAGTVSR